MEITLEMMNTYGLKSSIDRRLAEPTLALSTCSTEHPERTCVAAVTEARQATLRREATVAQGGGGIDKETCVICVGPVVAPVELPCAQRGWTRMISLLCSQHSTRGASTSARAGRGGNPDPNHECPCSTGPGPIAEANRGQRPAGQGGHGARVQGGDAHALVVTSLVFLYICLCVLRDEEVGCA